MMKLPRVLAIVMMAASLAGCSTHEPTTGATPAPTQQLSDLVMPTPSVGPSYTVVNEVPKELDEAIRADLNTRGLDATAAEVVEARKVTWRDGSLGCPQPGMSYTQALTPGWQVLISVAGVTYDYRFAEDAEPMLCESGITIPTSSPSDI